MKRFIKFFLLIFISMTLGACFIFESRTIKIGEFTSLTGSEASFGINANRGVRMAVEEFNLSGGINGKKIELIVKDTESSREKTIDVVTSLIKEHKVLALIGEIASDRSLAAAVLAQTHQVPMITPSSTNPGVTAVGSYIFRSCYVDPFQGFAMAKFAKEDLNLSRVAIFRNDRSNYSSGLAEYFTETFEKHGGEIVMDASYSSGDSDFTQILKQIHRHKPEAIFIPGYYSEVGEIAKQIRELEIKAVLLGGDGWDSQKLLEDKNPALLNSYYTNHFTVEDKSPEAVAFVEAYKKKYNDLPDGVAAMGYDAARLLFSAMRSAPSLKRDQIRDQLAQTKNFLGVTGSISFDENRNPMKSIVILKVDKGSVKFIRRIDP